MIKKKTIMALPIDLIRELKILALNSGKYFSQIVIELLIEALENRKNKRN